jgi:hypothetical protein
MNAHYYCWYCDRQIPSGVTFGYSDDIGPHHVECQADADATDEFWANLRKPRYEVTVWDCDREDGGPEEGGWSFETGTLVTSIGVESKEVAEMIKAALEIEYPYTGKRGYYSKQGPDYSVRILDRQDYYHAESDFDCRLDVITYYPIHRPHYE